LEFNTLADLALLSDKVCARLHWQTNYPAQLILFSVIL